MFYGGRAWVGIAWSSEMLCFTVVALGLVSRGALKRYVLRWSRLVWYHNFFDKPGRLHAFIPTSVVYTPGPLEGRRNIAVLYHGLWRKLAARARGGYKYRPDFLDIDGL